MEDLKCLVYTSVISSYCNSRAMEHILTTARKKNEVLDITGILVHTPRLFMQYIEGPTPNICHLFNKIKLDHRHQGILLCHFSPIEQRIFPDWKMGYKDLTKNKLFLKDSTTSTTSEALHEFSNHFMEQGEMLDILKVFL
ncbi:MAG: BLUF domain-containing protein [Aureispira sp.]